MTGQPLDSWVDPAAHVAKNMELAPHVQESQSRHSMHSLLSALVHPQHGGSLVNLTLVDLPIINSVTCLEKGPSLGRRRAAIYILRSALCLDSN